MVGVKGLEPSTSASQTRRASQLRHTPVELSNFNRIMVGVRGLEPPTSASRTLRASQLRHTPK
jgi:hypothetical protein